VKDLAGGPQPDQAVDSYGIDFWLERNVYTSECTLAQSAGSVAPECGSRQAPYAARTTWRSNHNGSAAPSEWSTVRIPTSLYRAGPPDWWCSESGAFPNVGAPTDDAGSGPAAFPKLPAQRLAEGLACGATAPPPAVPAAPVLLEN
jgi:hypothetical protein